MNKNKEKMNEFAIGQRVVVNENHKFGYIGYKGVVTDRHDPYLEVSLDGDSIPNYYFLPSELLEVQEFQDYYPQISTKQTLLPADAKERKAVPIASGVLDYFTSALIEVAKVSHAGNQQHNPGQPLHWARGKSADHADTMLRHFVERGFLDTDGLRHSAKMAWRALAVLQMELEAEGAPMARGAKE